jgi:hypothetical protein
MDAIPNPAPRKRHRLFADPNDSVPLLVNHVSAETPPSRFVRHNNESIAIP